MQAMDANGNTFKSIFERASINFVQFDRTLELLPEGKESEYILHSLLYRHVGLQFAHNQVWWDLVIPIFMEDSKSIRPLLIQVKNRTDITALPKEQSIRTQDGFVKMTEEASIEFYFGSGPAVVLQLELGSQQASIAPITGRYRQPSLFHFIIKGHGKETFGFLQDGDSRLNDTIDLLLQDSVVGPLGLPGQIAKNSMSMPLSEKEARLKDYGV
jgi:hypothetical protein